MSEKLNRYFTRTVEHIHRVQKNMVTVVTDFRAALDLSEEQCRQLMHNVMKHDRSKFSLTQFEPYVELTEYYHQRKVLKNLEYDYPNEDLKAKVEEAVEDHYFKENHHPERLKGQALKMSQLELIEVVCDLQAMAQEFNEGSCRGYFDNVWVKKQSENFYDDYDWEVTKDQMRKVIGLFEWAAKEK